MRNFASSLVDLLGVPERAEPYSWDAVEAAAGLRMPGDYKEMIDRTGAVIVDDWLCLFGPEPGNRSSDIAALMREREHAWAKFRESGVEMPRKYFVEGSKLLAFAAIEDNYFFWHAKETVAPEAWSVVFVDADLEGWYDFELSATECMYKVLVGEIRLEPFDDLFGGTDHSASAFPG
ncbi:hypothetical protein ACFY36_31410 [Actinoplanes sp. NPDC000266]